MGLSKFDVEIILSAFVLIFVVAVLVLFIIGRTEWRIFKKREEMRKIQNEANQWRQKAEALPVISESVDSKIKREGSVETNAGKETARGTGRVEVEVWTQPEQIAIQDKTEIDEWISLCERLTKQLGNYATPRTIDGDRVFSTINPNDDLYFEAKDKLKKHYLKKIER